MKRRSIASVVFLSFLFASCRNHGDINLKYSESKEYYTMDAWFHEDRTRAVEEYMDDKIGARNSTSFINTRMDTRLGLDDHTTFFIEKFPGHLKIELNKRENSAESYREIKSMCEGIKNVLR